MILLCTERNTKLLHWCWCLLLDWSLEFPTYAGEDEQWMRLRPIPAEEFEPILVDGKNAIQRLNELYHAIPFEMFSPDPDAALILYKCALNNSFCEITCVLIGSF